MIKIIKLSLVMVMLLSMAVFAAADELPMFEKTDRFDIMETESDLSMISRDGELIIHISESTGVIFEDETDARERLEEDQTLADLLDGRNLIVTYSVTTRSMPPQTTPEKIVILYEIAVPPIYKFSPDEIEAIFPLTGEIVVDGDIIEAPAPYYSGGVVMVPLREIAETLGFDVEWVEEQQCVRLGIAINLWIGKDSYIAGRRAPIELGAVPELIDDSVFVPLTFFHEVVTGYDAYSFEGQVVIVSALVGGDEVPAAVHD